MLIGSKSFQDLTLEECKAFIEELRSKREALRNEALARKAIADAKGIEHKEPRQRRPRQPTEADNFEAQLLQMMKDMDR